MQMEEDLSAVLQWSWSRLILYSERLSDSFFLSLFVSNYEYRVTHWSNVNLRNIHYLTLPLGFGTPINKMLVLRILGDTTKG